MTHEAIHLESELRERARRRSAALGINITEYVRRLVEADLRTDPAIVFNLGSSGGSDIARNKDGMLGEAFGNR